MSVLIKIACLFCGGALGSAARFWIGEIFRMAIRLPGWTAILCANLVGCLIIGLASAWLTREVHIATLQHSAPGTLGLAQTDFSFATALILIGFCGGLTTFSTFSFDNVMLFYEGKFMQAALNIVGSVVLSLLAVCGGILLAGGVTI